MSHLKLKILAFSTTFSSIKSDMSGNTVWPKKVSKWMILFLWFSNTVAYSSRFFESSDESMYSMLAKIAKILYGQFYHCVQLHMLTLKIGIYRGGNFWGCIRAGGVLPGTALVSRMFKSCNISRSTHSSSLLTQCWFCPYFVRENSNSESIQENIVNFKCNLRAKNSNPKIFIKIFSILARKFKPKNIQKVAWEKLLVSNTI